MSIQERVLNTKLFQDGQEFTADEAWRYIGGARDLRGQVEVKTVREALNILVHKGLVDRISHPNGKSRYRRPVRCMALAKGPWRTLTNEQIGIPDVVGPPEWAHA